MNKLSLFSGIGGIDLAAHWAGMKTVAFCEREPFPQKVLQKHWPGVPIYDDVCTLTAEKLKEDGIIGPGRTIDIISAGYPCQPESLAGERKGEEDDRWLWPEVHRLLQEVGPRWFVGENVFGHVSMGLDIVLSDLENINYTAEAIIIPAAAVGAPHRRDRVIVLAHTSCELPHGSWGTWSGRAKPSDDGQNVGYTERSRCSRKPWGGPKQLTPHGYLQLERGNGNSRAIESELGGVLDGLSDWMDRYKWPAGQGAEQYDWEPPRVATGIKERTSRLKALGNAVNPVQFYPIMAAIKAINDRLI